MSPKLPFKITFWKVVLVLTWLAGLIAAIVRFTGGLGAATNLSDKFPWGLWVGFDVITGVGLAAGGFTLAAAVYVFHVKRFYPVLKPAILTAFLGYVLVIIGLLFDVGRPDKIYNPLFMGNLHSALFEVAMCVMFYTTVLFFEFSPNLFDRLGWSGPKRWIARVTVPLVILGVILSTMHQSSLGSLFLIVPQKLYTLWYSTSLPLLFYVSAIAAGCAMVIFESHLSFRAFGHRLKEDVLTDIGRILLVVLVMYLLMKIYDFYSRGVWSEFFLPRMETLLFWLEILPGLIVPIILLSIRKIRLSTRGLYVAAVCTIVGFLLNRLNVSTTGFVASSGVNYFPSWMEIAITLALVSTGFFIFAMAVRYLPIFRYPETDSKPETITIPEEVFDAEVLPKS
ncbi:MAG: Ni/Fe-hydrogenase cytochrome b subunit [candidate division Zixibacteria bacterium]|nr:Ni/Fe-hydrogenase cytochrome b subunit [candidate division Zixibacteria bacterium]